MIPFKRCPNINFPFIDLDEHSGNEAVMLLQTVRGNMGGFTKKQVQRAVYDRSTQAMMEHMSKQDLKIMASRSRKALDSSGLSNADIANTNKVFGSCYHIIRRKRSGKSHPE